MRFRIFLSLLTTVTIGASDKGEPSERAQLFIVTHFDGLQELYRQLQNRDAESPKRLTKLRQIQQYPNVDSNLKESLCNNVFRSPYFEVPRDDENLYVTELRKTESNTYMSQLLKWLPPWGRSKETSPYKLRSVSVSGTVVNEYVFTCVVKDRFKEPLERYFISTAYNVNKDENEDRIAGRFIFARDRKKELVVYALAEEAASTFADTTQNIELFYLEKREKVKPTERPEDDPVCKLSDAEKLRLCTIVMNSPLYAGKVKFLPIMKNVETNCERDVVSVPVEEIFKNSPYLGRHTNLQIDPDAIFEEWVIGCKALTIDEKTELRYYISRGYRSNRAFVYKLSDRKLILDQYSADISVLVE